MELIYIDNGLFYKLKEKDGNYSLHTYNPCHRYTVERFVRDLTPNQAKEIIEKHEPSGISSKG